MKTVTTIEEALRGASFNLRKAGVSQSRAEAEMLLAFCLKQSRLQLKLQQEDILEAANLKSFNAFVQRRCNGEPFAYIKGSKEYYGRNFIVNPAVLIPRPETEMIIDLALKACSLINRSSGRVVNCLDLGTGSGVLAITMATEIERIKIWAVDISKKSLLIAEQNARVMKVSDKITFCRGSYFDALVGLNHPRFDLIVSNPPYISKYELAELPQSIKNYEPVQALFGGEDGLDGYRQILAGVPGQINMPGALILEIGALQQKAVEELCRKTGLFKTVTTHLDLSGRPRVIEAVAT